MKKKFSFPCIGLLLAAHTFAVDMPRADYAPPLEDHTPPCHETPQKTSEDNAPAEKIPLHKKGKVDHSVHIAAVVNDRVITTRDLEERLRMLIRGNLAEISPQDLAKAKQDILRQMIDEKLQLEPGSVLKDLKSKGVSEKTIKDYFGSRVAWSRLISYYRDTIEVGKKDLAEQAKEKDLQEKQFLLAELVFQFDSIMDEQNAHEQALQALARVQQGEHFSQVAHEMSYSPSAASGGDIGWIQESHCEEPIRKALYVLEPGQLSKPIRTENAYKIILLRNVMHPNNQTDTLTARQLEIKLAPNLSDKEKEEEKTRLDGLFETIEGCAQFDKVEEQLEGEMHIYKDVSLPDLSEDLQTVLKDLPVGKPSQGYINDNSVIYLMVCNRALAKMQPVNQEEKADALVNQRLGAFAEQKLRDIRRVAAIDVRV
jgi:peptidyl-prolyl cis-trans isomerase SurA